MQFLANPARFSRIADRILPWSTGLMLIAFAAGLFLALIGSPPDYQQGDSVRIMYIHVPSAWMASFTYVVIGVLSIVSLIWKHPLADVIARSAALPGAVFTALALATGSLWGKPMWGTYWVWDARLTSVLVLLFLYLGYLGIWRSVEDEAKAARAAAILALVGLINIPIIKFSVEWWNTLHQPASIIRAEGPTIAPEMLWPLFVMFAAFGFYFVSVLLWRVKGSLAERRVRNLMYQRAAASR